MIQMVNISEDEYNHWLMIADEVESDRATFTECCGSHEFDRYIHVRGMLYVLCHGWYPEEDTVPDAKYKYKTVYWWGIKKLWRENNQEGDGI
jgi:hypothetical protein